MHLGSGGAGDTVSDTMTRTTIIYNLVATAAIIGAASTYNCTQKQYLYLYNIVLLAVHTTS